MLNWEQNKVESIWDLTQCASQMSGCQKTWKKHRKVSATGRPLRLPSLQYRIVVEVASWCYELLEPLFLLMAETVGIRLAGPILFQVYHLCASRIPFDGLFGCMILYYKWIKGASDWWCGISNYNIPRIPGIPKGLTSPCPVNHWLTRAGAHCKVIFW